MIGSYYSTGIQIKPVDDRWLVSADFLDHGFCNEDSTEGTMRARYQVKDPAEAAKILKEDMEKLGIEFRDPSIYFPDDSDNPEFAKHTETIDKVCVALGWRNIYAKK